MFSKSYPYLFVLSFGFKDRVQDNFEDFIKISKKDDPKLFHEITHAIIFPEVSWFYKTASNANIYMFCDFGRIALAKMLVEG